YLRMPPPASGSVNEDGRRARSPEELQVRATAQRLIADHLRPIELPRRAKIPEPNNGFWGAMSIDLTGAQLYDFTFSSCQLLDAAFDLATFAGRASFDGARFQGDATFNGAEFTGGAWFSYGNFHAAAEFVNSRFGGRASFKAASFERPTGPNLDLARAKWADDHIWPPGWHLGPADGKPGLPLKRSFPE
ncbi:MAG TPA: pentapeptide repeat-containing protein, partial [Phytomonospora sp.]